MEFLRDLGKLAKESALITWHGSMFGNEDRYNQLVHEPPGEITGLDLKLTNFARYLTGPPPLTRDQVVTQGTLRQRALAAFEQDQPGNYPPCDFYQETASDQELITLEINGQVLIGKKPIRCDTYGTPPLVPRDSNCTAPIDFAGEGGIPHYSRRKYGCNGSTDCHEACPVHKHLDSEQEFKERERQLEARELEEEIADIVNTRFF